MDKSERIVRLERDWDYAPRIRGAGVVIRGHHAIRKKEELLLMDFFFRRTEGALLMWQMMEVDMKKYLNDVLKEIRTNRSNPMDH